MIETKYIWLDVDIPICRDFMLDAERSLGFQMNRFELTCFFVKEFDFGPDRANIIIDTLKGESFNEP